MSKISYKKMQLEELIILSQKNDYKALEELIKREQKKIYATFVYLSKEQEPVADLTQEALLRMAKNIWSLKNPKTFKSWLNHIVVNLFYDHLRKKSKKPPITSIEASSENDEMNLYIQIPDFRPKPSEKAMSMELDSCVKAQIRNLPEPFRIAIILRELQGLSYSEIAESTNSSIGTVKSRIARARVKLQQCLRNYI